MSFQNPSLTSWIVPYASELQLLDAAPQAAIYLGLLVELLQPLAFALNYRLAGNHVAWSIISGVHAPFLWDSAYHSTDSATGDSTFPYIGFVIIFWISVAICLIPYAGIAFTLHGSPFDSLMMVMRLVHQFVSGPALVPLLHIFASAFACSSGTEGVLGTFPQQQCLGDGLGTAQFVVGIIMFILLAASSLLYAIVGFTFDHEDEHIKKQGHSIADRLQWLFRIGMVLSFHLLNSRSMLQYYIGIVALGAALMSIGYSAFLPFYNQRLNSCFTVAYLVTSWAAVVGFIELQEMDPAFLSTGGYYAALVIGSVVAGFLGYIMSNWRLSGETLLLLNAATRPEFVPHELNPFVRASRAQDINLLPFPSGLPESDYVFSPVKGIDQDILADLMGPLLQQAGVNIREVMAAIDETVQVVSPTLSAVHTEYDVETSTRFLREWTMRTGIAPSPHMISFAARIFSKGLLRFPGSGSIWVHFLIFINSFAPSRMRLMKCLSLVETTLDEADFDLCSRTIFADVGSSLRSELGIAARVSSAQSRSLEKGFKSTLVSTAMLWRAVQDTESIAKLSLYATRWIKAKRTTQVGYMDALKNTTFAEAYMGRFADFLEETQQDGNVADLCRACAERIQEEKSRANELASGAVALANSRHHGDTSISTGANNSGQPGQPGSPDAEAEARSRISQSRSRVSTTGSVRKKVSFQVRNLLNQVKDAFQEQEGEAKTKTSTGYIRWVLLFSFLLILCLLGGHFGMSFMATSHINTLKSSYAPLERVQRLVPQITAEMYSLMNVSKLWAEAGNSSTTNTGNTGTTAELTTSTNFILERLTALRNALAESSNELFVGVGKADTHRRRLLIEELRFVYRSYFFNATSQDIEFDIRPANLVAIMARFLNSVSEVLAFSNIGGTSKNGGRNVAALITDAGVWAQFLTLQFNGPRSVSRACAKAMEVIVQDSAEDVVTYTEVIILVTVASLGFLAAFGAGMYYVGFDVALKRASTVALLYQIPTDTCKRLAAEARSRLDHYLQQQDPSRASTQPGAAGNKAENSFTNSMSGQADLSLGLGEAASPTNAAATPSVLPSSNLLRSILGKDETILLLDGDDVSETDSVHSKRSSKNGNSFRGDDGFQPQPFQTHVRRLGTGAQASSKDAKRMSRGYILDSEYQADLEESSREHSDVEGEGSPTAESGAKSPVHGSPLAAEKSLLPGVPSRAGLSPVKKVTIGTALTVAALCSAIIVILAIVRGTTSATQRWTDGDDPTSRISRYRDIGLTLDQLFFSARDHAVLQLKHEYIKGQAAILKLDALLFQLREVEPETIEIFSQLSESIERVSKRVEIGLCFGSLAAAIPAREAPECAQFYWNAVSETVDSRVYAFPNRSQAELLSSEEQRAIALNILFGLPLLNAKAQCDNLLQAIINLRLELSRERNQQRETTARNYAAGATAARALLVMGLLVTLILGPSHWHRYLIFFLGILVVLCSIDIAIEWSAIQRQAIATEKIMTALQLYSHEAQQSNIFLRLDSDARGYTLGIGEYQLLVDYASTYRQTLMIMDRVRASFSTELLSTIDSELQLDLSNFVSTRDQTTYLQLIGLHLTAWRLGHDREPLKGILSQNWSLWDEPTYFQDQLSYAEELGSAWGNLTRPTSHYFKTNRDFALLSGTATSPSTSGSGSGLGSGSGSGVSPIVNSTLRLQLAHSSVLSFRYSDRQEAHQHATERLWEYLHLSLGKDLQSVTILDSETSTIVLSLLIFSGVLILCLLLLVVSITVSTTTDAEAVFHQVIGPRRVNCTGLTLGLLAAVVIAMGIINLVAAQSGVLELQVVQNAAARTASAAQALTFAQGIDQASTFREKMHLLALLKNQLRELRDNSDMTYFQHKAFASLRKLQNPDLFGPTEGLSVRSVQGLSLGTTACFDSFSSDVQGNQANTEIQFQLLVSELENIAQFNTMVLADSQFNSTNSTGTPNSASEINWKPYRSWSDIQASIHRKADTILLGLKRSNDQFVDAVSTSAATTNGVSAAFAVLGILVTVVSFMFFLLPLIDEISTEELNIRLMFSTLPEELRTNSDIADFISGEEDSEAKQLAKNLQQSERLLQNILPPAVSRRLKGGETLIADQHESVTVVFACLYGFDEYSAGMAANQLVFFLNSLVVTFDAIVDLLELEKVKTIADNYFLCGGLTKTSELDHALRCLDCAVFFREALGDQNRRHQTPNLTMKIGVNTGPAVAGVIGTTKVAYDLWGDTVNTASRMYSTSKPGRTQCTATTYEKVKEYFSFEESEVEAKGKGKLKTYLLKERLKETEFSWVGWRKKLAS